MANLKITQLPEITTPASNDVIPIVSVSGDVTSKIQTVNLLSGLITASSVTTFTNKTINGNSNTLTVLAASQLSGITPVANGGTGRNTLTSATILAGNGTSAVSLYTTTGSGTVVALATSPSFTTPALGVASATSINKVAITAPGTAATLTIANNKTLTVNNTMTLAAGADSQTFSFPSTSDTVVTLAATQALTNKTISDTLTMTTGAITQSGAAAHITLTPGASKFVKIAALEQDATANNYRNNTVILTGWTFVTGDGSGTDFNKTITFGITFTTAPVVVLGALGIKDSMDPTTITDFGIVSAVHVGAGSITTGGFTASLSTATTSTNGRRYGMGWTAIGTL